MTEEIQQLLKNLRLRKMAEMVEGELTAARKDSPSYSDVLASTAPGRVARSAGKKVAIAHQGAHLPEQWTLESFPFKKQPGVSRRQIQELAELEFIPQAVNVVFMGRLEWANRISVWTLAEGPTEWLSRTVHQSPGSVR